MLAEVLELYAYNRWANERALAGAGELSAEQYNRPLAGSFPSLRATLEHLLSAEAVWLSRWRGNPLGRAPDLTACTDAAALGRGWEAHWAEQHRFLATLAEGDLARPVEIRLRSGIETVQPLRDTLTHVVNHATYHRGQVTTMLRQLGADVAATDYIVFWDETLRR
jgi:uncharacterized damage-inducible protein DinB